MPHAYDPLARYPPTKPLRLLSGTSIFGLVELIFSVTPPLSLRDVIFISLDLEFTQTPEQSSIEQIGIAVLDTRVLFELDPTENDNDDDPVIANAIKSRLLISASKRKANQRGPKFRFGAPEYIASSEVGRVLKEVFEPMDKIETSSGPANEAASSRNVVLIGHSVHSDLTMLRRVAGIDLENMASVKTVLDTGRMICNAYELGMASRICFPLRSVLRLLGIKYDHLHNAGNDALYTMKAFLLMFWNWRRQKGTRLWNLLDEVPESATDVVMEELYWERQLEIIHRIGKSMLRVLPVYVKPERSSSRSRKRLSEYGDILAREEEDTNMGLLFT